MPALEINPRSVGFLYVMDFTYVIINSEFGHGASEQFTVSFTIPGRKAPFEVISEFVGSPEVKFFLLKQDRELRIVAVTPDDGIIGRGLKGPFLDRQRSRYFDDFAGP
jgi:hypothetical protein